MPGECDAEGLLPYHSSRLCASDDKKKKYSGTNMGQHSNSKNSKSGPSDGVKAPTKAPSRAHGKEAVGEGFTNLKQRKPRVSRAKIIASPDVHTPVDGSAGVAVLGKIFQISGQKRKVYQPKVQVQHEVEETSPLPMILHLYITSTNHRREPSTTASSVPPPTGKVMINVDAVIFTHDKSMGAGVVMREHSGSCIVCYGIGVPDVILPELAEAIAIQRGLQFALSEEIQEVLVLIA
ncbi:non-ltr retroelement reverse transcriptase [Hordeum vulgare]|nr:non-ltr retroelement reverse transcriptase [Hordeum vulgare]